MDRPKTSTHSRVAAGIRAELARSEQSPDELAEYLGISPRTFRRRLGGEGLSFNLDEVDEIAGFFGIAPVNLVVPNAIKVGDLHVMARDIHIQRQT